MDRVRDYGIKYVELAGTYGQTPEQFKQLLEARGLKAIATHFSYDDYRTKPEELALQAKALGLKYAGCAWISHDGPFDEKKCREAHPGLQPRRRSAGQTRRQNSSTIRTDTNSSRMARAPCSTC